MFKHTVVIFIKLVRKVLNGIHRNQVEYQEAYYAMMLEADSVRGPLDFGPIR